MTDTQFGFDFGPMTVTRSFGDERYGYSVRVAVGGEMFEIQCTPKGRRANVSRHVGLNRWEVMK